MRAMKPEDNAFVLRCILDLREESPVYHAVPDTPNGRNQILDYVRLGVEMGALFGIVEPGKGFILGGASDVWYAYGQRHAFEQLLYVAPHHRHTTLAPRLIRGFEAEAKRRGCTKIFAGSTTGIQDERVLKLYQRLGWSTSNPSVEKDLCVYRDLIP